MANVKISNLEQINIYNPDDSFVMVVAQSEENGPYRNYRISLNQLRAIIGSIEGDIVTGVTEEQVKSIVANAIEQDNINELSATEVQTMINNSIAKIVIPEQGISEEEVNNLIRTAIAEDNRNELTQSQVIQLIKTHTPTQSLNETRVNELIDAAITADNITDLQETRVQEMIDASINDLPTVEPGLSSEEIQDMIDTSITADNLKGHIETVIPDVIPEVLPNTEIQVEATDEPIVLTVKEVAEKVVVQENTVTEITKEIKEDCVCEEHADDCFNAVFN